MGNGTGDGEGLPVWWRHGRTRVSLSTFGRLPSDIDRRWLLIDLGLVAALLLLCVGVGMAMS
jgi:hypothetical protein